MEQVEWDEWKPYYHDIAFRLKLDFESDCKATQILNGLAREVFNPELKKTLDRKLRNKEVVICGAGPALEAQIQRYKAKLSQKKYVVIAADGAISALLAHDIRCDVVVTDLDGTWEDILSAVETGTIAIVHGHGDNIPHLYKYIPHLPTFLASTQVEPQEYVFLWGGFTDGDRACYLAVHYNPKKLILLGMDFGTIVGKWSKPGHTEGFPATPRKKIKLEIAKRLINELAEDVVIEYGFGIKE